MAEGSDRVRTGSGTLSDLMDVLARTHLDRPRAGRITWQPKEHNYSTSRRNQAEPFYERKSRHRHGRQQLAPGAGAAFSVDLQDLCKGLFARSLTPPPPPPPPPHWLFRYTGPSSANRAGSGENQPRSPPCGLPSVTAATPNDTRLRLALL